MNVYWLEQTEADLPNGGEGVPPVDGHAQDGAATTPESEWLGAKERVQLSAMRFAKRRADWQLGRWTAKHAVAACLQLPADLPNLAGIEVRPIPSGAPEIFLGNKWAPVTISLSHRAGRAVCAVANYPAALGCDLEVIESHSDAFIADYFATEEQALVARAAPADRPWLVTLLWSAKESALKALRAGLRLDTRCVIVTLVDVLRSQNAEGEVCVPEEYIKNPGFAARQPDALSGWRPLRVRHVHDQTFLGWWQRTGNLLRTIVAAPPPARPLLLNVSVSSCGQSLIKGGHSNADRQSSGA
jgi:4'-phosphopantetheinyl transferase